MWVLYSGGILITSRLLVFESTTVWDYMLVDVAVQLYWLLRFLLNLIMWYDLMLVGSCPSALVRLFLQVGDWLNPSLSVPNGSLCSDLIWTFIFGLGNVMHGLHDSVLIFPLVEFFHAYFGPAFFVLWGCYMMEYWKLCFVVVRVHYNTL